MLFQLSTKPIVSEEEERGGKATRDLLGERWDETRAHGLVKRSNTKRGEGSRRGESEEKGMCATKIY